MEKNKELGHVLKGHRENAFPGLGLRRVAAQVGIDYAHLFRIEAGQYVPSDENLLKLLNAYNIDPTEKLRVFNMARFTPSHQDLIDQAYQADPKSFAGVFYRKNRSGEKRDENNDKQQKNK